MTIPDLKINLRLETIEEMAKANGIEIVALPIGDYVKRKEIIEKLFAKAVEEEYASFIGNIISQCEIIIDDRDDPEFVRPTHISIEFGQEWDDGNGSDTVIEYYSVINENDKYANTGEAGVIYQDREWELNELLRDNTYQFDLNELELYAPTRIAIIYPQ